MCRFLTTVVGISLLMGCATLSGPKRTFTFAGVGAATGAVGGSVLSPNPESKTLNTLIFGLVGAIAGGVTGMLTDRHPESPKDTAYSFDQNTQTNIQTKSMILAPYESLPEYVKKRLQPLVIEEFVETDQVDEDGVLREAHKAYRIKRQPEFEARPVVITPKETIK